MSREAARAPAVDEDPDSTTNHNLARQGFEDFIWFLSYESAISSKSILLYCLSLEPPLPSALLLAMVSATLFLSLISNASWNDNLTFGDTNSE